MDPDRSIEELKDAALEMVCKMRKECHLRSVAVGWINEKKLNCPLNTISLKTQVQEVVEVQKSDRVCQVMTSVVEICDNYLKLTTYNNVWSG